MNARASSSLPSYLASGAGLDWIDHFHPFTLTHLVVAGAFTLLILAACFYAKGLIPLGREGTFRRRLVALAWLVIIVTNVYWLLPGRFDIHKSLPLHLCDLAIIVAALALQTQRRWLRNLLYFWGLCLSSQGFLTPTLEEGARHIEFWLFWVGHTVIIGGAAYDVIVLGYRPFLRDLAQTVALSLVYGACVSLVNIPFGLNYGYVGNAHPDKPTLIDHLGPWPLRILWITLLGIGVMTVFWLAWAVPRRLGARRRPH